MTIQYGNYLYDHIVYVWSYIKIIIALINYIYSFSRIDLYSHITLYYICTVTIVMRNVNNHYYCINNSCQPCCHI